MPEVLGPHPMPESASTPQSFPPQAPGPPSAPPSVPQYNYGFVVEKTAAARLPPSVS